MPTLGHEWVTERPELVIFWEIFPFDFFSDALLFVAIFILAFARRVLVTIFFLPFLLAEVHSIVVHTSLGGIIQGLECLGNELKGGSTAPNLVWPGAA